MLPRPLLINALIAGQGMTSWQVVFYMRVRETEQRECGK